MLEAAFSDSFIEELWGVGAHGTPNTLDSIPMIYYVLRILLLTLVAVLFLCFVVNWFWGYSGTVD